MARKKKEVYHVKPLTEGKKNIISALIDEYDIETAEDIQDALRDLMGGTIKSMMEAEMSDKQVVTGNSKFSKALTYFKNRRNDLMTYLEDGHCSLSNNWSENSIRPVTVGRKNWLFSSSVDGAEASMNIYTIIEMAKLHGLNRQKYIEYILEHRPSTEMTDEELSLLAPWNKDVQETCGKCGH